MKSRKVLGLISLVGLIGCGDGLSSTPGLQSKVPPGAVASVTTLGDDAPAAPSPAHILGAAGAGAPSPVPSNPWLSGSADLDAGVTDVVDWTEDGGQAEVIEEDGGYGAPEGPCSYPNYSPTHWAPDAWQPFEAADAQAALAGVKASMPGHWHGLVRTPWTLPYEVNLTFTADGHYSGHCSGIATGCCSAFYYGTDHESARNQYRLDATLSGNVFGEIDIPFKYGDAPDYLPAWQGVLLHIERDASGNGLRFQFKRSDGYGPVEYDLRRSVASD